MVRLLVVTLVTTGFLAVSGASQNAESFCEPSLVVEERDEHRYRDREERCEGLYVREVSGYIAALTSFTRQYDFGAAGEDGPLTLSWDVDEVGTVPALADLRDASLRLRADSNVYRVYYRMDTQRPLGGEAFEWPTTVLRSLSLGGDDIGVYGFLPVDFGEVTREVYVPLSLSRGAAEYGDYRVAVFPTVELEAVAFELSAVAEGFPGEVVRPKERLGHRRYPSAFPVTFGFALQEETGLYHLLIEVEGSNGRKSRIDVYFYHERS